MNSSLQRVIWSLLGLSLWFGADTARAESRVRAHVDWLGQCGEREALDHELSVRGVELEEPTANDAEPAMTLSVSVGRVTELEAWLTLSDASGRVHERRFQVNGCDELRAVVAWVLLVLAREGKIPTDSRLANASASFATEDPEARPPAETHAPAPPVTTSPRVAPRPSPAPVEAARSTLKLGSSFLSGFGFLPSPALGPALFAEFEPRARRNPVFRASVFYLSTQGYERNGASIGVNRLAAQLSVRVISSWTPLSFAAALEGGRLTGAGSGAGLARSDSDSALWLAAELGPRLSVPLVRDVLEGELGGALAFTPLVYSFEYRGGEALSHSENLEVRAFAGLMAKLR